jgi:hypothetical protein
MNLAFGVLFLGRKAGFVRDVEIAAKSGGERLAPGYVP